MQTLYIDVYFLINFTVDYIALYFAIIFSKVPTNQKRLILGSLIGAMSAVMTVLMPEIPILKLLISLTGLFVTVLASIKRVSLFRTVKTLFSFLIFSALLGALVNYLYGVFDKYLYEYFKNTENGAQNRKLLMFSMIVLLSIGVFKMLVSFFGNIESEGSVEVEIEIFGKTLRVEAFIDSGNLAVDPMDMRPVLLLKKEAAEKILPNEVIDLSDPDDLEREMRKRIRLIPISTGGSTHVLTGIRSDGVWLIKNNDKEEISVTVAIDREGGNYGGYQALMPSSVINNEYKK